MVRPSEQPDRYRIVYGRRRLAAVRKLGGTIKAIVRTLDDDASVIAQGQENSLRLDPSFIEKAIFIKEMQDAGYKPAVIQDALGLTRQGVSNHRVVIEALPSELVRLIGPAHGIGRRQWGDLANLSTQVDLLGIAQKTIAALPPHISSPDRFQTVFSAASIAARAPKRNPARARSTPVKTAQGRTCGTLVSDERSLALKVSRKDNPAFCQWIEARAEDTLRQLFDQWERETGQTKP
jgi:ParB family chromosome partitioning protein